MARAATNTCYRAPTPPIVFSDQEVDYASRDEAQEILGQIMVLYNTVNAAVMDAPTLLPADCPLRDDVLANFEDAAPMAQGIVKSSRIRLTDPQDDGLESRREPGMLGVDHRDSA